MNKYQNFKHKKSQVDLSGIAFIIAFLIGILLFLLISEPVLGVKPNPIWIAGLMGFSVSAVVFWVWSEIRKKRKEDNGN